MPNDQEISVDERAVFEVWFESQWPLTFERLKYGTAPDDTKEAYATAYDGWMARAALVTATTMSEAVLDVLAERKRVVEQEGFTAEHDDEHDACEMADAAAAYALHYSGWAEGGIPVEVWPADWSHKWWKPTTPRRDLVKAAQLLIAEIERIDRASAEKEL